MKHAVYQIRNIKSGHFYIGSSINYKTRWKEHMLDLKKNEHHCIALQRAFNKHTADYLEFTVLEFVNDPNKLVEREQFYIDSLNPKYNSCRVAGSMLGFKMPPSAVKKNKERNTGFGNGNAKIKESQIALMIELRKKMTIAEVAAHFGVHVCTIERNLKKHSIESFKKVYSGEVRRKLGDLISNRHTKGNAVAMFTLEGEHVRDFKSIAEASRFINRNTTTLYDAIKNNYKCANHRFKLL